MELANKMKNETPQNDLLTLAIEKYQDDEVVKDIINPTPIMKPIWSTC
jgi:hypothetical protein